MFNITQVYNLITFYHIYIYILYFAFYVSIRFHTKTD